MFDLFGAEMPLAVRFFLAFLIVLGLIGVTAWAVRRLGSGRLGTNGVRGRQPRIAVIDHASVDGRRRLILVRRDNVEHLLMVGGPSDVVVEANIVRATSAGAGARGPAVAETASRAIPLPEIPSNGSWPLQPESTGPAAASSAPRRVSRIEAADEANSLPPPSEPHSRSREPLTNLADDLAGSPLAPGSAGTPSVNPAPPRGRSAAAGRPEARPDPRAAAQPTSPEAIAAADKTLAEMAQRLEAALRKPKAVETPSSVPARGAAPEQIPEAAPEPGAQPTPMRPLRSVETKPARPESKAAEGKAIYETLEQEMANLLGRQPNKG
ncbi:MAG TPA: flagellar biosynthesis protein FliO [Xanthobacteraceae bacterium]